jgi:hypothetical protein
VTIQDPGFDDERRAASEVPDDEEEPKEAWEEDDTLSPQERLEISRHKSEYERSKAYNILRNKRTLTDLRLGVEDLFARNPL